MSAQCNTTATALRKANADNWDVAYTLQIFLLLFIYKATILSFACGEKAVKLLNKNGVKFTGGIFRGDARDKTDHVPFQCYLNVYYVASFHSDVFLS